MRKRKKIKTYIICFFICMLLLIGVAYSILKQEIKVTGKANLVVKEQQGDYIVTYKQTNKWYTNGRYFYEIEMNLLNNTQTLLDGWNISIKAPIDANIVNFSNVICTLIGERIEFKNVSYNAQVPAKTSVTFEFQVSTTDAYYAPQDIIINGSNPLPPEEPEEPEQGEKEVKISINQDNQWSSGEYQIYQYTTTITNIGTSDINSWSFDLELQEGSSIDQIWNGFVRVEGNITIVSNSTYNGIIPMGGEINFGFILKAKQKEILKPINIILK